MYICVCNYSFMRVTGQNQVYDITCHHKIYTDKLPYFPKLNFCLIVGRHRYVTTTKKIHVYNTIF